MAHKSPQPSKIRCNSVCGFTRTGKAKSTSPLLPLQPELVRLVPRAAPSGRPAPHHAEHVRVARAYSQHVAHTARQRHREKEQEERRTVRQREARTDAERRDTGGGGATGSTTTFGKGDGCVTACDVTRASLCVRVPRVVECGA